MSFEQIKAEVDAMSIEQQNHLVEYVMHLRRERDARRKEELARKIEGRDPSHWVTVDRLKEEWNREER
jgi:hypothetical protein